MKCIAAQLPVTLTAPPELFAMRHFFEDFTQVSDQDVVVILQRRKAAAEAAGR